MNAVFSTMIAIKIATNGSRKVNPKRDPITPTKTAAQENMSTDW